MRQTWQSAVQEEYKHRTAQEGRHYIFIDVALELHNKYAALAADS